MVRPCYVTGFNQQFFLQHAVLAQALKRYEPEAELYICDFGLNDAQVRFFREQGSLLRWSGYRPGMPPFFLKANLLEYVAPLTTRPIVWIDADAFPVAPMSDIISHDHASASLWTTPDLGMPSIQAFIDKYKTEIFRQACSDIHLDTAKTYLNSGFFIVNDPFFLRRWQEEAARMPCTEVLYEQNAFNLAAYQYSRVCMLDGYSWNLHGAHLMDLSTLPNAGLPSVRFQDRPVQIIHATSERESFHRKLPVRVKSQNSDSPTWSVKLLNYAELRSFQLSLINMYVDENFENLRKYGVF